MQQMSGTAMAQGVRSETNASRAAKRCSVPRSDTRMSDEKLAAALLTLAADLLKSRHPAVAAMIGYAIAEVIDGSN